MKFKVHSISSKYQVWEETALEFYRKRLHEHELIFLNHKHKLSSKNPADLIQAESGILLNKIEKIDHAIAWDIKGRSISSNEFANLIKDYSMNDHQIEFVIGGSHGLSGEVLDKSKHVISASKLTFPHRLFKIILSEQIYRACSIISNHPYHK
mgnify:CR=1 FL=1